MIDPRGPRVAACLTSAVLVAVLLLSARPTLAGGLLAAQAGVFALGARGRSPYQLVFRHLVRPRLSAPTELEPEAPTRFAQLVGLAFAASGAVCLLTGLVTAGLVLTGLALVAALLNAVIGLCLGCEVYLIVHRLTQKPTRGATA